MPFPSRAAVHDNASQGAAQRIGHFIRTHFGSDPKQLSLFSQNAPRPTEPCPNFSLNIATLYFINLLSSRINTH